MVFSISSLSLYPDFIILFLIVLIGILVISLIISRKRMVRQAQVLFETWKHDEQDRWHIWIMNEADSRAKIQAEGLFKEWQIREEQKIRQDAVHRSHAVIKGKITEHLVPWFSKFPYNPSDARFLGSPVDFIIFNGLSEGNLNEIVIVEVKTGTSSLSPRERSVARIVEERKIRFEVIRKE
ncbi:Holliday junction resolvase [Methanospirillum sp. J.3.6.1-F.2.7.3]|uniref:Holliday junction resolvase n=1 Tax=Methanospirillum purgamenti TaxID=2834276 RepID=A0A8E7EKE9_9EURY|nr:MULTISPECIES: Holliday junction resolvase-like protein [Methanospirillum]MDX8549271.1 Holliday junction resolvase-like protein [Methanospirillum hungatei]QVV89430.1 Holliday junction resolvase [Methanospirillum sp. J.3.6.1-F.2.7.3]